MNRQAQEPQAARSAADHAVELANEFVRKQPLPDDYTLEFGSVSQDALDPRRYQVRYTKVFKEPTKENPPYRLVIVEPGGRVRWGNP